MARYTDRQKTILTFRKIKGVIQEGQLPRYLRSGFDLSAIEEEGGLIDHVNNSEIHLTAEDALDAVRPEILAITWFNL